MWMRLTEVGTRVPAHHQLRGHGVVAKVPFRRLYPVTPYGHRVLTAGIARPRLAHSVTLPTLLRSGRRQATVRGCFRARRPLDRVAGCGVSDGSTTGVARLESSG